jgi:cytochrome c oxidase assembly protein subunit 15
MKKDHRWVRLWLLAGVIMVFVQILLGGITRLTGSGLSITKWDIVTGTLPPLNAKQWDHAFTLYKATPQYQKINEGMSLDRFKSIFFWEYFHRVWARLMGFVFMIPFTLFAFRKSLSRALLARLAVVIGFASLAAIFGWIMVASGLVNRPWVNAYKLTIHLSLGIGLLVSLFYAFIKENTFPVLSMSSTERRWVKVIFDLIIIQVVLGGMVSGMKSALLYPTWPKMNQQWIPETILNPAHWSGSNFLLYDQSGFMPALSQFLHRFNAILIFILMVVFAILFGKKTKQINGISLSLLGIIVVQIVFGVLTLLGSIGSIPVFSGILHQGTGILLLLLTFYYLVQSKNIQTTD